MLLLIEPIPQFSRFTLGNGVYDEPAAVDVSLVGGSRDLTFGRGFEKRERELLINDADIKVNDAGAGDIDPNTLDREPEEEFLGRNTRQGSDPAVAESPRDVPVVMQFALEFGIAFLIQVDLELAALVDFELRDALGQQAHGKPVGPEHVVDRRGRL